MFSGIVQGTGEVSKVISKKGYISIEINPPKNFNKSLKKGASISVDGVCLTSVDKGINEVIKWYDKFKYKFNKKDKKFKISL